MAPPGKELPSSVAEGGQLGSRAPKVLWLALWGFFTRTLLLSLNRSPNALGSMVSGMASGEPHWLASLDTSLGRALNHHGTEVSALLAVSCALVAVSVFFPKLIKWGLLLAVLIASSFWVAQNFGTIFTANATDPNSGPLLVLLAATMRPSPRTARAPVGASLDAATTEDATVSS